jgi:hypothetical protein
MKKYMLFMVLIMFGALFAQHEVKAYRGISAPHDHDNPNNCYNE